MTEVQSRTRPGSVTDTLAALQVGENLTISRPHGKASDSFDQWVQITKRKLSSSMTPNMARVTDRFPDRDFEIETGVMISSQNRAHVVLVVTRLADRG
jgi:hypothetical protein